MKRFDVLVVVHYSYDSENAYYEVFSMEAETAGQAFNRVKGRLSNVAYCRQNKIRSSRVLRAVSDGSLFNFVGKRVGQFIQEAMATGSGEV